MLLHKGNHIILYVLLLAFAGQSLAAPAMPCPMMNPASDMGSAQMPMPDMGTEDHSAHSKTFNHDAFKHHNAVDTTETPSGNCCDQDNACPMSTCVSAVMLSESFSTAELHVLSDKIDLHALTFIGLVANSLYRPPISL